MKLLAHFLSLVRAEGAEEAETAEEWAEKGMAEVSKVYDETGRELYMGAGDRSMIEGR